VRIPQARRRTATAIPQFQQSLHPLLQQIRAARGVCHDEQIHLPLAKLLPPDSLKGMAAAVGLLQQALHTNLRLLIVADYDADGATSCALALLGLRALGFAQVDYLVPNRFEYGYGLTPPIVELARTRTPDVLITVDNGIASHAGVALARHYGMQVLVTDHHLPAATLPDANAILNPNQGDCAFASKALAGVGVVFYLLLGLRKALREEQWFTRSGRQEPNLANLLDLVALGTVADVVPLDANNRILVQQGLLRLRAGRGRPGVSGPIDGSGRRSVYISINRNFLDPFLQAFDQPPPATTCGKRHTSNVPAQELALLNNDMVREFARVWGERIAQDAARTDDARVESMWLAAFARLPREEERITARAFLEAERAAATDASRRDAEAFGALAHALFSTKEFVFLR
jgi:hypothetical protein